MSERLYPTDDHVLGVSASEQSVVHRHYRRYETAVSLLNIQKGRWLDIACGSGYGSEVIVRAGAAESYVGIDRARRAILYATSHYADEVRTFMLDDAMRFEGGPFDAIVSVETIEHLPEYFQQTYVRRLLRMLRPSGALVISFPVGKGKTTNPYHLHEPTVDEVKAYCGDGLKMLVVEDVPDGTYGPFEQAFAVACP